MTSRSRRETKVPMKYRSEGDLGAQEDPATKKRKKEAAAAAALAAASSKKSASSSKEASPEKTCPDDTDRHDESFDFEIEEEEELPDKSGPSGPIPIASSSLPVATKTTPATSVQDLTTIGVGTFSIDKESVRSKFSLKPWFFNSVSFQFIQLISLFSALNSSGSLSSLRFKTYKRVKSCKSCANCLNKDCLKCVYCKDSKKYGGPGNLKKICKYVHLLYKKNIHFDLQFVTIHFPSIFF